MNGECWVRRGHDGNEPFDLLNINASARLKGLLVLFSADNGVIFRPHRLNY